MRFSLLLCLCDDDFMFPTGETGIGKTTLINTLFNTNLKETKSSHFYSKVGLTVKTYELLERNIPLRLTVVKTVGYGDQINKEARLVVSYFFKLNFKVSTKRHLDFIMMCFFPFKNEVEIFFFKTRILLCSTDWPGTHYIESG